MCRKKTVKPNETIFSDQQILAKAYQIRKSQADMSQEESEVAATKLLMEEQYKFLIDVDNEGKRSEEVFSLFRDYTKHEDGLINQRMTWMITIQSFLIATFGFSYQKKLEIISNFIMEKKSPTSLISPMAVSEFHDTIFRYNLFLLIICSIGIGMSAITFFLLRAASLAIKGLEHKWGKIEEMLRIKYLPQITGGGSNDKKAKKSGEILSNWLTYFFFGFWLLITVFIGSDIYLNWVSPLIKNTHP